MIATSIRIYIAIFGDNFNTKELGNILNIEATMSYKKGDKSLRFPNAPIKKETSWQYSTGEIETYDFENVANMILDLFESKVSIISDFVNENNLSTKLYIVPIVENQITPALYFNKRLLKFLYDLNAEVDIDMYVN